MSVGDVILFLWILCGAVAVVITVADLPGETWEPFDYVMLVYTFLCGPVTLAAAMLCWKRYR